MVLHKSINIDHFVAIIVKEFLLSPFSITQCRWFDQSYKF